MEWSGFDVAAMQRAIELARGGEGRVEPNPMVGAVVTAAGTIIGEGFHQRFGGPHAEVGALLAAGAAARGATLYVTLEPCCHHGKTPPCTEAIIKAGIARVVIAARDPFPAVNGGGIAALRAAGIAVEAGLCEREATRLTAPFRKLVETKKPWVIAKWAMSLDGRMATATGESQWISSPESRAIVHQLRGRVDAIVVGIGTALADDPLLTARPDDGTAPKRQPLRVVLDSEARLPLESRLVQTARDQAVLGATGPAAPPARREALAAAGCEIWIAPAADPGERLDLLLAQLGRRQCTNVLVEGGSGVLGSLFDRGAADEVWAFIAPKIIGGAAAPAPIGGRGIAGMADAAGLQIEEISR
ncbi:MAG: bifunctional diaminohydroxyphosphoribosylaminopyrimidine deaminase/5-amino-6-(5-phosphoribosylamino)uracil reductase RibD, partial [Planctomycetia bacterium]